MVVGGVELGDGLDAGVDDAEAEGGPEREGCDDGFGEEHVEGADGGDVEEGSQ